MKIKTVEQAKDHLLSLGITPVEGTVYNFFKCGHASVHVSGTSLHRTIGDKGFYCCPDCARPSHPKSSFLTKLKICTCKREYIGKKLKHTPCAICTKIAKMKPVKITKDQKQAYRDRYSCVRKSTCLNKILELDKLAMAIPWCLGCSGYKPFAI